MSTKNQHYVAQVYLKPWVTDVPNPEIEGATCKQVYCFSRKSGSLRAGGMGEPKPTDGILFKHRVYTLYFQDMIFLSKYVVIRDELVDKLYDEFQKRDIIAFYQKEQLKTKELMKLHIGEYRNWEFFSNKSIPIAPIGSRRISGIEAQINSGVIETELDRQYEKRWEGICKNIVGVVEATISDEDYREVIVNGNLAHEVLRFMLIQYTRNPEFTAFDKIPWLFSILRSVVDESICGDDNMSTVETQLAIQKDLNDMERTMRLGQVLRALYNCENGVFKLLYQSICEKCCLAILTPKGEARFITSDNPVVLNQDNVSSVNKTGFLFPLSPKHLLFIGKGDFKKIVISNISDSEVDYYNSRIITHASDMVVSCKKVL